VNTAWPQTTIASSAAGKGYARGPRDPPRTGAGAKKEEEEEEGGRTEAEAANEAVDRTLGTYSRYAIHARSDVVNQRLRAAARIQETTAQFARRRRRAQKPRTPPPRKRPRRVLELSSRRDAPSTS